MKAISIYLVALLVPSIASAGGAGGGSPPSKELQMELLSQSPGEAALFMDTDAIVRLGVNGTLDHRLELSAIETRKKIVKAPESDIKAILDARANTPVAIEAVNLEGEVKVYEVEQGNAVGSVVLIEADR